MKNEIRKQLWNLYTLDEIIGQCSVGSCKGYSYGSKEEIETTLKVLNFIKEDFKNPMGQIHSKEWEDTIDEFIASMIAFEETTPPKEKALERPPFIINILKEVIKEQRNIGRNEATNFIKEKMLQDGIVIGNGFWGKVFLDAKNLCNTKKS